MVQPTIQGTILNIIRTAQNNGLQVQYDTVISTAFAWWMGRVNSRTAGPGAIPYQTRTIGDVMDSYNDLVAKGLIPPGVVQ